nr:SufE family protein [Echinimonas agarilytica]
MIELGRALPPELQANKEQQYWINGCESSTWLMLELDDQHHKLCCKVESEANVIRGVLHVLALHFNTLNSKQQASFDGAQWLTNIGIVGQLSTTRNQGMRAVMQQLHAAVGAV